MLNTDGSYIEGCESSFDVVENKHVFDLQDSIAQCSSSQKVSKTYVVLGKTKIAFGKP